MNKFGERLVKVRISRNMKQKELASLLGVDQAVISRYENGKYIPNCNRLVLIAKALKVSLDELMGLVDVDTGLFYVQDTRTVVGNCMSWWAKDCNGYTCHLKNAHVFTKGELTRVTRETDRVWPKEVVDDAASLQVDHQKLEVH